jgi:hypothetical protein
MLHLIIVATAMLSLVALIDPHRHVCACGRAWWHLGLVSGGSQKQPRARRAHTCTCGLEAWERKLFRRR